MTNGKVEISNNSSVFRIVVTIANGNSYFLAGTNNTLPGRSMQATTLSWEPIEFDSFTFEVAQVWFKWVMLHCKYAKIALEVIKK